MPTYTVRTVIPWKPRAGQIRKFLYEERITAWTENSIESAMNEAEKDAKRYAANHVMALDFLRAYCVTENIGTAHGSGIFSLLRESDLEPAACLDAFFDTGAEREGDDDPHLHPAGAAKPGPPARGPATNS